MSAKQEKVIYGVTTKWKSLLLCLLSLGVAGVLYWINSKPYYWFPESGIHFPNYAHIKTSANNVLNGFQFVVKAYDILIGLCVGSMTVDIFKRRLINKGVPYGLLTGAYRTSDLRFFLTRRFAESAWRAKWLGLMLLSSYLLGIAAGPAAAILIVPKLGSFPMENPFSEIQMPILTGAPLESMWIKELGGDAVSGEYSCNASRARIVPTCPTGGFSAIFGWISSWQYTDLPDNITFPDPSGRTSRQMNMFSNDQMGTLLSVPAALTISVIAQFKRYVKWAYVGQLSGTESYKVTLSSSSGHYQPLVHAKCQVWNYHYDNSSAPDMQFPYKELNCFDDEICLQSRNLIKGWHIDKSLWNSTDKLATFMVLNQGNRSSTSRSLSTLAFLWHSKYKAQGVESIRHGACSYMAHWIPTNFSANSTDSEPIGTNITDVSIFSKEDLWKKDYPNTVTGNMISFDESYLQFLNLDNSRQITINNKAIQVTGSNNLDDLFAPLRDADDIYFLPADSESNQSTGNTKVARYLERATGAIVTDAIARIQADAGVFIPKHPAGKGQIELVYLGIQNNETRPWGCIWPNRTFIRDDGERIEFNESTPSEYLKSLVRTHATISLDASRYGYGYGLPSSSFYVSYTVLILYGAIVLGYWLVTGIRRTDTVTTVADLQDLTALAWRSSAPVELQGHASSDMDKALQLESVSVRATSSRELVLALDKHEDEKPNQELSRLAKDKEYW